MEVQPFFPLWGENTTDLLKEFVRLGFVTHVVAIRENILEKDWLGRVIDKRFIQDISRLNDIDPCAENGEYHSFVSDGPMFRKPVPFLKEKTISENNHHFLILK